ncbi:hypothetical protein L9F63_013540, partial [Diploptera punctata]
ADLLDSTKATSTAMSTITVSRVLFLHKHDCSTLRQQLRLLLKRPAEDVEVLKTVKASQK